jgi:hypothetical protein
MTFLLSLGAILLAQQATAVEQVDAARSGTQQQEVEQLSKPGDASSTQAIGLSDAGTDKEMPQLSRPDTTVEFARVEGMDRCSAELLSAEDAEFCARRIEARSSDYTTRSEAPLTAEQVLVGEKYASAGGVSAVGASREAARRDVSAEDKDLQALASITLVPAPQAPAGEEEKDGGLPSETEALIEAIVNQLAQPGGN